ncbi:MAG TPA: AMP-binding protein [Burkholderiales bacterium]|nr:AMP-binding protein [Burkholderiales bacterium]
MAIEIRFDAERTAYYRAAGYWRDDTLRDWLDARARERPDRDALRQGERRVTWSELARLVRAFEYALDGLGIGKGDVVAVQLPNVVEFVVAYLAIAGRGAVMQTLHMPYRAAELETLLGHSGAAAAVVMAQAKEYAAAETVLGLRPKLPALRHVIAVGVPPAGALGFADLLSGAGAGEPAPVVLSGADPFLLLYTSGTTSAPKGAPHAYQTLLGNVRVSAEALGIGPDDVLLSAAPYTHLYGLFTCTLPIATGATSLLLPAFSPPDLAALIHAGRPTAAFAAPAHIAACFALKLFDGKDLSSLRYLQMSGSAVPPALARAFEPLMRGGKVMQLWGMTELQAGAYTRLADDEPVRAETTGRPSPGTELRVVRDDGSSAPPGEEGELQVRGASVFAGYLNDPDATRAAFTADGWFRTGDLATIDAQGNTRLAGRTKDIINRGGVKFNPLDVETLLLKHPAIEQAVIVPMPDPVLGEKACLFVTLKSAATLTLAEVTGWLDAAQVSKLKWPERLEVVDAMPLTPTRKVIKGQLVKRLAGPQAGR